MEGSLLELFITFFKIGAFTFGGGYATLPLISDYVVDSYGWLTTKELTDLVALSQMTPGPIAVNAASFVGTRLAGFVGAFVATAGVVAPSILVMSILAYFLFSGKKMPFLDKILKGLRAGVVGLIAVAALNMFTSSIFMEQAGLETSLNMYGLVGFIIGGVLSLTGRFSVIQVILISALAGFALYGAQMLI